jgi:hypothetical protein
MCRKRDHVGGAADIQFRFSAFSHLTINSIPLITLKQHRDLDKHAGEHSGTLRLLDIAQHNMIDAYSSSVGIANAVSLATNRQSPFQKLRLHSSENTQLSWLTTGNSSNRFPEQSTSSQAMCIPSGAAMAHQ